ncbi:1364_t:CDS:2 [Dentiscutata erythropus]|uniref:1364_t:CDS:1 n=1 Tax=Dentiscutata erythropus TaxID=1348616 RepID=A0A9N8ZLZ9_9GLOM|nr:1364_t:CDS:2 [Dentiscutata erythropus]
MSSNDNLSSRLELQKRLQHRLKSRTDTTSRPTPRTYDQLPQYLQQVLPDNYTYIIKSYKEIDLEKIEGAPTAAFDSTFYVNIASTEAIEEWRSAFHNKTGTVFRITRADKVKGIKVIYHKDFHCRHADIAAIKYMQKTYAQKAGQRRSRNTNCQCLAKIRLEKSRLNLSHPCEIHLLYNHNHPLETLNVTPQTPSIASVGSTSDESGKSTPQHNLEFESTQDDLHQSSPLSTTFVLNKFHQFVKEIDLDILKGDNEYCHGIIKFMESYRQASPPLDKRPLKRAATDPLVQDIDLQNISSRKRRSTNTKRPNMNILGQNLNE